MTSQLSIALNSVLVLEGLQILYPGDAVAWAVTKLGVTTIANDGTLVMYCYKGSTDKTSTFFTGSMSATGNVVTTKTTQGLVGGDDLFVTLKGTCDGMLQTFAAFWVHVNKVTGK